MSNDDKRSYRGEPIIAVAVGLLLVVSYVVAYFGLSEFVKSGGVGVAPARVFEARWQFKAFWPAIMIEQRIRGKLLIGVDGKTMPTHLESAE